MIKLLDEQFDKQFSEIEKLNWYPWVGKDYETSKRKLLIIGESHYLNEDDDEKNKKRKEELEASFSHTRDCLHEVLIDKSWSNPTYQNIMETLCDRSINPDNDNVFSKIAYHNLIQEPLWSRQESPSEQQASIGWQILMSVINILKPTDCIMLGVRNDKYFNETMRKLSVSFQEVEEFPNKIGNTRPRKAMINGVSICFIQHPGNYYSPEKWHDFLKEQMPEVIQFLNSK